MGGGVVDGVEGLVRLAVSVFKEVEFFAKALMAW
jgi:hypothetical protein